MPPEDFAAEHKRVLDKAQRIFESKSNVRGQMWLDFPPSDKVRELRERVSRIENAFGRIGGDPESAAQDVRLVGAIREDAEDIINYAAFLIKQLDRGQRG